MTAHTQPRHPGPSAWGELIRAEVRMVIRDTAGLIVPIGLPVLVLVMAGLNTADQTLAGTAGLTAFDVYAMPIALVMIVAVIGVINMPSFLATYRTTGVLRRLAVTPAHPAMVLVAQIVTSILQTLLGLVVAIAVASALFGLSPPRDLIAAIGVFGLTAAAMYSLGMMLAALAPSPNASVAIGFVTFLGLGALGGMFTPTDTLPQAAATIGEVLPFGAAVLALTATWLGQLPELEHLASLGATTILGAALATTLFRWD